MSVIWDGYVPYDPGVDRPLHELGRAEARGAFDRLMAAKGTRIEMLRALLGRNGIGLVDTDDSIQELNDWFRSEVEGTPGPPIRLRSIWYSVVNDMALFLGDVVVRRAPNIDWVFFQKGSRDMAYQRHVLMGFSKVANPLYNFDVDLTLATYGHRVVADLLVEPDAFRTWVSAATSEA